MHITNLLPAFQLSLRAGVAAGLSIAAAQFLLLQHPIYALISAVLVTDLSPKQTRKLVWPRLMGTVVGALLGGFCGSLLQSNPFAIGLSILAAMLLSHLLRLQDAAKIAGYVCGIALLNHGDQPWSYALYRLVETILGIGMAVIVSYVPKLLSGK